MRGNRIFEMLAGTVLSPSYCFKSRKLQSRPITKTLTFDMLRRIQRMKTIFLSYGCQYFSFRSKCAEMLCLLHIEHNVTQMKIHSPSLLYNAALCQAASRIELGVYVYNTPL